MGLLYNAAIASRHFDACDLQSLFCSAVSYVYQLSLHYLHSYYWPNILPLAFALDDVSWVLLLQRAELSSIRYVVYFQGKSRLRVVGLKYVGSCPPETTRLLFCAPRSKCHFHRERTCFLAKWFIWVQQPFYHLLSQNTVTVFLNITHGGIFCSYANPMGMGGRKWVYDYDDLCLNLLNYAQPQIPSGVLLSQSTLFPF